MKSDSRLPLVLELREIEKLSYAEIGRRLGLSGDRVRQLYGFAAYRRDRAPKEWWYPLSIRAANCLNNVGVENRSDALIKMNDGTLRANKIRNYGRKTHEEVCSWLGLKN